MIPSEVHAVHLRLGYSSGGCGRCYPAWTTWHADARAGRLRPSIVGGIPIDSLLTAASQVPLGAAVVSSGPRGSLQPARAG